MCAALLGFDKNPVSLNQPVISELSQTGELSGLKLWLKCVGYSQG